MYVSGNNIPAGTTVATVISQTYITLSANPIAPGILDDSDITVTKGDCQYSTAIGNCAFTTVGAPKKADGSTACGANDNFKYTCNVCSSCPAGQYQTAQCTATADTKCEQRLTECDKTKKLFYDSTHSLEEHATSCDSVPATCTGGTDAGGISCALKAAT